MPSDFQFGAPWAADGETRPSRFRTPLAQAPGHNGGVLYVRDGDEERWVLLSAWNAWVSEAHAAPVQPDEAAPWDDLEVDA
jgi:hypothetical protein